MRRCERLGTYALMLKRLENEQCAEVRVLESSAQLNHLLLSTLEPD